MTGAHVVGLDHVQLAMPAGQEPMAREFYVGLLGLAEVEKPAHLAARGGVWFESDGVRIHLGVEQDFRPARKAHPGLLVTDLDGLAESQTDRAHRSAGRGTGGLQPRLRRRPIREPA